jgi:hypothetical protein
MPFVERNKRGDIVGLFAVRQRDGQEFLPDDSPEVARFRELHPVPPELLRPRTREEVEKSRKENEAVEAEYQLLQRTILAHSRAFAELENALGALLYTALNIHPKSSRLAYAAYFSPTGFDARVSLVGNVILTFSEENSGLDKLGDKWKELHKNLDAARRLRNAIAHGTAQRFIINNKTYVRLASPAFDVIRVWRDVAKRQIPGLTADELSKAVRRVRGLENCVDCVQRVITACREDDVETVRERLAELETSLQKIG